MLLVLVTDNWKQKIVLGLCCETLKQFTMLVTSLKRAIKQIVPIEWIQKDNANDDEDEEERTVQKDEWQFHCPSNTYRMLYITSWAKIFHLLTSVVHHRDQHQTETDQTKWQQKTKGDWDWFHDVWHGRK